MFGLHDIIYHGDQTFNFIYLQNYCNGETKILYHSSAFCTKPNTRHRIYVFLMLDRHLWRWPDIKPTLVQRLVLLRKLDLYLHCSVYCFPCIPVSTLVQHRLVHVFFSLTLAIGFHVDKSFSHSCFWIPLRDVWWDQPISHSLQNAWLLHWFCRFKWIFVRENTHSIFGYGEVLA